MRKNLFRIASVLAFIIGAMAIFAGGQVLLGKIPDYYVIGWLPIANFIIGLVSAFVVAPLLWGQNPFAVKAAIAVFSTHAVVMLILQTAYGSVVAVDSIVATTVRLTVWGIILFILLLASRKK